jgi:hypothetical protein
MKLKITIEVDGEECSELIQGLFCQIDRYDAHVESATSRGKEESVQEFKEKRMRCFHLQGVIDRAWHEAFVAQHRKEQK